MCKRNHVLCTCQGWGEVEVDAVGGSGSRRMKSYTSLLSLPEHPSEDEHEDEQHPPYPRLSETFYNASTPSSSSSSIYSQSTGADTDATIYSASSAVVKMVEDELGRGKEVSFLWLDGEDEVEPVERKVEGVVGGRDSGTGEVRVEEWWEEEEEWEPWDDGGSVVSIATPLSPSRARVVKITGKA